MYKDSEYNFLGVVERKKLEQRLIMPLRVTALPERGRDETEELARPIHGQTKTARAATIENQIFFLLHRAWHLNGGCSVVKCIAFGTRGVELHSDHGPINRSSMSVNRIQTRRTRIRSGRPDKRIDAGLHAACYCMLQLRPLITKIVATRPTNCSSSRTFRMQTLRTYKLKQTKGQTDRHYVRVPFSWRAQGTPNVQRPSSTQLLRYQHIYSSREPSVHVCGSRLTGFFIPGALAENVFISRRTTRAKVNIYERRAETGGESVAAVAPTWRFNCALRGRRVICD
ncbi:hypothetical protein EVAR_7013_1 [Eumeta japonica]|uniref:Uncharacterized protein n=1 Tax=Eumeta variegata TaxID=151549 RepID=A0A4C1TJR5_EUMVA|nr:hypothetical protein EVAR_7013_1 [Eumeta japonica]